MRNNRTTGSQHGRATHGTRSLDLCQRIGDTWGEATTLVCFGIAYRAMGTLTEAFDCFNQALHLYGEINGTWGQALTLTNLGIACSDAGRHDEAVIRGRKAWTSTARPRTNGAKRWR